MVGINYSVSVVNTSELPTYNETNCWNWDGRKLPTGYGLFYDRDKKRKVYAHRFFYEKLVGKIPDRLCVLHHCYNPSCVNPAHLFLGTQADNMADKVNKGRQRNGVMPEELNPRAKLTRAQVDEIRTRYQKRTVSQQQLAKRFGVSQMLICNVLHGKQTEKLTKAQIDQIKEDYIPSGITLTALAKEYGVCHQTISWIVNDGTWKETGG